MANSEKLGTMMQMIPFSALEALGRIFKEGLKYGRNNWKNKPDADFIEERANHAIRHLMLWCNGDRQEEHLAKVMWFATTTIELLQKHPEIEKELLRRNTDTPPVSVPIVSNPAITGIWRTSSGLKLDPVDAASTGVQSVQVKKPSGLPPSIASGFING